MLLKSRSSGAIFNYVRPESLIQWQNPAFKLKDVPEGTQFIRFKMVDLDVPNYDHGGGVVKYTGQSEIAAGAFKYKSPCPPNGAHTYEWRATAQNAKVVEKLTQLQQVAFIRNKEYIIGCV